MNVLLHDVDSKIPNLALMKISKFHKLNGDHVFLNRCEYRPDKVYISKVFSFSKYPEYLKTIETEIGGIAVNNKKLPEYIESLTPDYDLYPSSYSQGRTTIGCFRGCWFCNVIKHEGKIREAQHPMVFYDKRFDSMMIMDNNWLYLSEWFFITSQWIIDNKITLIENGIDARLIDQENAKQLCKIRFKTMKIALDQIKDANEVINGIIELQKAGFKTRSKLLCYVYVHDNNDDTFNDAMARAMIIKEHNTTPFIMFNCLNEPSRRTNAFKRWCNIPAFFYKYSFEDYCAKFYKTNPLMFT